MFSLQRLLVAREGTEHIETDRSCGTAKRRREKPYQTEVVSTNLSPKRTGKDPREAPL